MTLETPQSPPTPKTLASPPSSKEAALSITSLGASDHPTAIGEDELPGKDNYLIGKSPSQWHRNVPTYGRVELQNVYPGIDVDYFGTARDLEYDYVVAPRADPSVIHIGFTGASSVTRAPSGSLVLSTAAGSVLEKAPTVYQVIDGVHHSVNSSFTLSGGVAGIALSSYDHGAPLTIDPTIVYASYVGGSSDDQNYSITTDNAGNIYAVGYTDGGGFPTASAYQGSYGGGVHDIGITKLSPGGASYVYSTYLGGSGSDVGYAIAVDAGGDAYIAGMSTSTDYPVVNAYQSSYSGSYYNGVVSKLSADGSTLDFSTYVHGGNGYTELDGIAVNGSGNAYVAGYTSATNFPTVNPIQSSNPGGDDAVLFELSTSGSSLAYSTYLGGVNTDVTGINCLAIDAQGDAYLAVTTDSSGLATAGAAQTSYGAGANDDLVYKVNSAGSAIDWATYIGGNGDDESEGIALDGHDNVFLAGFSSSTNFPTVNAIYGSKSGGYDGTLTEIAADGASFVYSTYIGGSSDDLLVGVAVDAEGDAYFGGYSESSNFPMVDATQGSYPGGSYDGVYGEVGPADGSSAPQLLVSSYLGGTSYSGGSNGTVVYGIALDRSFDLYLTGLTSASNFTSVLSPAIRRSSPPMGVIRRTPSWLRSPLAPLAAP